MHHCLHFIRWWAKASTEWNFQVPCQNKATGQQHKIQQVLISVQVFVNFNYWKHKYYIYK